jgi:DNA-binding MarR family transcriptional regulator
MEDCWRMDDRNHGSQRVAERAVWPTRACNCLNLRRAASAITKIYDEKLAPSGLTISQYSILKHIEALAPVSVSEPARHIKLDRTTLVRNLKPLEAEGLIEDISQGNSRNRGLRLTPAGTAKCGEAKSSWNDAQDFILRELGTENVKKLNSLLSTIEELRI